MSDSGHYVIRDATAADGDALRPLWSALYEHETKSGMVYRLKPDAFEIWWTEAKERLGSRFFFLYVVEDTSNGSVTGFFSGKLRRKPPIYEVGFVATVTEIYVSEQARGHGLAKRMVEHGANVLRAQGITVFDVVGIAGNAESQAFWKSVGWTPEAVQFRLDL
ncbi:MAG: GNAT family N-acetyltransferase [Planctomycetes bacterium]|nr:GNAT family N-acetyltransferase [Planctomycetota bacterium]NUQ35695.1 GNAT family N-acetyltransferase [Planctomycetaceae bacterium]